MNIALWIVQGMLALMFILSGITKAFLYDKAKSTLPWVKDSSKAIVAFIGVSELFGGLGLIIPHATGIMSSLTPIAALALALIMLLAAGFHARRNEYQSITMNVILLALAVFIAIGRF